MLALYVIDPQLMDRAGASSSARILGDLAALDEQLAECGGRLCVRIG